MHHIWLCIWLVFLGGASLWAIPPQETPMSKPLEINIEQAEHQATVKAGEALVLHIPSQPSTGYGWRVAESPTAEDMTDCRRTAEGGVSGLLGGWQKEEWRLQFARAGEYRVKFAYCRPWEADQPPARSFTLVVRVE